MFFLFLASGRCHLSVGLGVYSHVLHSLVSASEPSTSLSLRFLDPHAEVNFEIFHCFFLGFFYLPSFLWSFF